MYTCTRSYSSCFSGLEPESQIPSFLLDNTGSKLTHESAMNHGISKFHPFRPVVFSPKEESRFPSAHV